MSAADPTAAGSVIRADAVLISGLGLDEDPDTDGHVDGVGAFVGPGRVLLHMVRDPQHPDYENLRENRRRLETTDARGRTLEVIEFDARSRAGARSVTRRSSRRTSTRTSPTAP